MKNQCIVGYMMVVFLFLASIGMCADLGFKSDNEFGEWMTFYYQSPDPTKVPSAFEYFSGSKLFHTNAGISTMAFFSALFRKDSNLMKKTFDEISQNGSENAKLLLINALSFTQNVESKTLLEKAKNEWSSGRLKEIIEKKMAGEQIDLYTVEILNPGVLDMLWASFFATGEALPVQRIISVLHLARDGTDAAEMMVGGAANWSLKSNAQQHGRVLEICKSELARAHGITKEMLEVIITRN